MNRGITRDQLGCFAGQSSMCWKPVPSTQVFDSENAVIQLNELWNSLPPALTYEEIEDVFSSIEKRFLQHEKECLFNERPNWALAGMKTVMAWLREALITMMKGE